MQADSTAVRLIMGAAPGSSGVYTMSGPAQMSFYGSRRSAFPAPAASPQADQHLLRQRAGLGN